jgi:ABC-type ATPase involved in cell division
MITAIEISHLHRWYAWVHTKLFNDVSLSIEQGDFCIITGTSWSWKTSLLKLITGQLNHDYNQVKVFGIDLATKWFNAKQYIKHKIWIIFQDYKLIPWKNVLENIIYSLEIWWVQRSKSIILATKALAQVWLTWYETREIKTLSWWQQQRVAIARAIVHEPSLIIADEITGNLDPYTSEQIADILITLHKHGKTVVFITHDVYLINYFKKYIEPKFFNL